MASASNGAGVPGGNGSNALGCATGGGALCGLSVGD